MRTGVTWRVGHVDGRDVSSGADRGNGRDVAWAASWLKTKESLVCWRETAETETLSSLSESLCEFL